MKIVTFQDVLPNLRKGNKVSRFRQNLVEKLIASRKMDREMVGRLEFGEAVRRRIITFYWD